MIRPDDPRWDVWLDRTADDIYHRAGYHRFQERTAAASAYLIVFEMGNQALLWPYLERPVSQVPELSDVSAIDLDSVYGYPGPLYIGTGPTDDFLAEAWRTLEGHWRDQGVVSVFTRFHPLLRNAELALRFPGFAADGVRFLGETVSMDVRLSEEDALREYRPKLRRTIAVARRAGMTTRLDAEWRDLETFSSIYQATMRRNDADPRYSLTLDDFRQLRGELKSELHLFVTELDGVAASATIVTEHGGIVQSHIGGSADGMRALSPESFELDHIRRWARERGDTVLHLGGGRGAADDSLFFFKSRFSRRRHSFHIGRWVIDRDVYRELTSIRRSRSASAGLQPDVSYFPVYRAPLVAAEPSR